jgi:hypothetical protein
MMDVLSWLAWALIAVLTFLWSLIWFLISGWVSTLVQIILLVAIMYFLKYGWQRAPAELWRATRSFASILWSWVRARELRTAGVGQREIVRVVRVKEFGDINISTLLSLIVLVGLALVSRL